MSEPPKRVSRRSVLKWGAGGLAAMTGIGMVDSPLQVTTRTLRLPGWKADGFRVAQVSDVHLNNDGLLQTAREAVRLAVRSKPDLFVFSGDFLNFDREDCWARIPKAFEELEALGCPCLAVMGNHDYLCKAPAKVAEAAARTRLKLLVNEEFDVGGVPVVGLDDANEGRPDHSLVKESALVLLHEPDYVDRFSAGAGLVLSGHSHGGEICLPGGLPLYTPRGSRTYRSGFYPHAPSPVYVNRGTATLTPARVYCPPEVAVLTLRSA